MKQILGAVVICTIQVLIYNGQAIAAKVYVHPAFVGYDHVKPVKNNRFVPVTPVKGKTAGIKIKQGQ